MAYIGNGPGVASQRILTTLTATEGQTSFTPSAGYTLGYVDVFLNGVKLIDGTDYTAADGVSIVLAEAATLDDTVEVVAYFPRGLSDGYTKAEADARYMDINEETLPDQTGHSGKFLTTDGTAASWGTVDDEVIVSATEPTGSSIGQLWYDTAAKALKAYDGSLFLKVAAEPITLTSATGTIYASAASSLFLTGTGFLTDTVTVKFTPSGGSTTSVSVTATSDTAATVDVPSAVYASSAGTVISIAIQNSDQSTSGTLSKTVSAPPSGGTVTTASGYRYHTFTSSSTFTNTVASLAVDYLVVAGGGGGGSRHGGGGGAGGAIDTTTTLPATNFSIVIGGGGAGAASGSGESGVQGSASSALGTSTVGGGYGTSDSLVQGNGGSGGGSRGNSDQPGGTGTTGQGNNGGGDSGGNGGGGGGGKTSAGAAGTTSKGGNGGSGLNWKALGTYYAGGGGGGTTSTASSSTTTGRGVGGTGGGGNGNFSGDDSTAGSANTGGGGGGGGHTEAVNHLGKAGGSGVVIIRYQL